MDTPNPSATNAPSPFLSRRAFVAAAATAPLLAALPALAAEAPAPEARPAEIKRKIKLGLIGCGGRGSWIAGLFKKHPGYEMWAVADYFPEVAEKGGEALGIDKARRFSSLSGYQKLIASGCEAVAVEVPPYFIPIHARAAAEAGLHVYMAKPVAADVPGALAIEAAGKLATAKQRCFYVDYQMPTDPINIEVAKRIREGGLGPIAQVTTVGICGGFADPPKTANLESRLRGLVWVNDVAMGCDYIGNYDIHAIDAAVWVLGKRPVAAMGASRICRADPHGDGRDVCSVVYDYADGLVHNHFGQGLGNNTDGELSCRVHGRAANALVNYWGKAYVRGGEKHYPGGQVENLYEAGAVRNIATFYQNVCEGRFENETARRAVDGVLTCILGREAAARRTRLTMEELLKENKRLDVDLTGLKA
ncbi:MAG: Gfo/Idh/MocA family oxidoreductase [Planctomycetota bacterium]|nr:Gfo/Idh/MocA family oxidoreductase [Planctomycetota bacterium]